VVPVDRASSKRNADDRDWQAVGMEDEDVATPRTTKVIVSSLTA
jgi:hypothetical protein